jgi:DNA processing protein
VTERVSSEGLLLSEQRPGQPPRRHHFPLRNRLISGLSAGVLVVEAAEASGSLITARWAADQGRAVWAVPGRVDHPMARGCHRLIREGAALVEGPEEILAELKLQGAPPFAPSSPVSRAPLAAALLQALRGETLTADELAEPNDRDLATVLTALVELELQGEVQRGPGGLYRLS